MVERKEELIALWSNRTESRTLSRITSDLDFWLLRDRVEKYGLSKLPKSVDKVCLPSPPLSAPPQADGPLRCSLLQARLGLNLIATLLLQPSTSSTLLSSGPLSPYQFEPVPSALSIALRAKLDEARQAWLLDQDRQNLDSSDLIGREFGGGDVNEGEFEPGKIWRERWRSAVKRGRERFRERVCRVTGLLCDEKNPGAECVTPSPTGSAK